MKKPDSQAVVAADEATNIVRVQVRGFVRGFIHQSIKAVGTVPHRFNVSKVPVVLGSFDLFLDDCFFVRFVQQCTECRG